MICGLLVAVRMIMDDVEMVDAEKNVLAGDPCDNDSLVEY